MHVDGHDVPRGREGGVEERRNGGLEIRSAGEFAVLGSVEGALEIIDFRADVNAGGEGGIGRNRRIFQRGEIREGVEREKNAGDDAARTVVAHLLKKTGREMDGFEEMEEGALGVGAGNDGLGGDFFAGRESDAGDGAVFDQDARDFGVGANFGAGVFGGGSEGVRESARASTNLRGAAIGQAACATAQQKKRGGARGPRARGRAEDSSRGDGGAKQFRLEKLRDEIRNGHGAPANQALHVFLAQAAEGLSGAEKIPEVTGGGLVDFGRGHEEEIADEGTRGVESFAQLGVFRGVGFRGRRDCGGGFARVGVEEKRAAVGMRREDAGGGLEKLDAMAIELHASGD